MRTLVNKSQSASAFRSRAAKTHPVNLMISRGGFRL